MGFTGKASLDVASESLGKVYDREASRGDQYEQKHRGLHGGPVYDMVTDPRVCDKCRVAGMGSEMSTNEESELLSLDFNFWLCHLCNREVGYITQTSHSNNFLICKVELQHPSPSEGRFGD